MLTVNYKGRELQVAVEPRAQAKPRAEGEAYLALDREKLLALFACWQEHLWKDRLSESAEDQQQMEAWSEIADEQDPAPEKTEGRKP